MPKSDEVKTVDVNGQPVVPKDQIEIHKRYCIDGYPVVHYRIKRWDDNRGEFYYVTDAHGKPLEWNLVQTRSGCVND